LLGQTDQVVLEAFAYRGKQVRVRVVLPAKTTAATSRPERSQSSTEHEPTVLIFEEGEGSVEQAMMDDSHPGMPYRVARITVNDKAIELGKWLRDADLLSPPQTNEWEILLQAHDGDTIAPAPGVEMTLLAGDRALHYAPKEPTVQVTEHNGRLKLDLRSGDGDDLRT
jgi:hypothetical protein